MEYDVIKNKKFIKNKFSNKLFIQFIQNYQLKNYKNIPFNFEHNFLIKNLNINFNLIIKNMLNDGAIINDYISPCFFINYINDTKIKPFWNSEIKKLSDKIYLPTDENMNVIKNKSLNNTWFESKIYVPNKNNKREYNINYSPKNINTKENIIKTVKIKFFLNKNQKFIMKKIIGIYRYFYNRTIDYVNNYDNKTKTSYFLVDVKNKESKINIQLKENENPYNNISVRKYLNQNYPTFMLEGYNKHLIREAIKEGLQNTLTNIKKYKKTKKIFKMKYKTKKDILQTIMLDKEMIKKNGIFVSFKYKNKKIFKNIKMSDKIEKYTHVGSSLTFHSVLNEYTLNLSYNFENINIKNKEKSNKEVCGCDLGEKIFITTYSTKEISQIGINTREKIFKKCNEIDIIQSKMNNKKENINKKQKKSLRKAMHRKIKKIQNIKEELHYKTINYLTEKYSAVIISPFETKEMVNKLNNKVSRNMYNLAFYQFKKKLENKCKEKNVKLIIKNECYTTKTCTNCGQINPIKNRTCYCPKCKYTLNRDISGARNILLKNMCYLK
jgi:putative transposase